MTLGALELGLLVFAAFAAGVVDAIAGGGGLITLPALLTVGLPPHLALGTNKGQSVFGSAAALVRFVRGGMVDLRQASLAFPLGLFGSLCGAGLVLFVSPAALKPVVLVLLVVVAVVLTFRPPMEDRVGPPPPKLFLPLRIAAIAFLIGAYDGFFGPGTGTFLILAFVSLLGTTVARASADAKVVNFASNLAAVALFGRRGVVVWSVALPMAVGQALGGFCGAHLAVRGGDRLVRKVVLAVVVALAAKLAFDLLRR